MMTNFFKRPPEPKPPRKRLRPVSKKREKVSIERKKFVEEQLALRMHCEAQWVALKHVGHHAFLDERNDLHSHCSFTATEIHEPLTRARKPGAETILDVTNSVALCSGCHAWVHAHPEISEQIGLLKSSRGK
jgi:hypothetical protein